MTMTKVKSKEAESSALFAKAEGNFQTIADQVSNQENCNLMFNMLLHYNFMLNDFSTTIEGDKRQKHLEQLQTLQKASKHN